MTHINEQIPPVNFKTPNTVENMISAVKTFLSLLQPNQRAQAIFPFEIDERYEWAYTPIDRNGLKVEHMSAIQKSAAWKVLETGYSERAQITAQEIIALEDVLGEWESIQNEIPHWERSTERYWFSVFGNPGSKKPWGWRAGGHHIGIGATVVNGDTITVNPVFFGANPATILHGQQKGKRTLAKEEDMARELLKSMSPDQRSLAIVEQIAPDDILTRNYRTVDPNAIPMGIHFKDLQEVQKGKLVQLVKYYVSRGVKEFSSNYWRHICSVGMDNWTFAWAGSDKPGRGHYYAVKSSHFLIEYDNTQNNANHIHSVMRDYFNDWGEDILALHYKEYPHDK